MSDSLENKLALMVDYCQQLRYGTMTRDDLAFNSLLDDPEVAGWIDRMNKAGRIKNTRFITKSR